VMTWRDGQARLTLSFCSIAGTAVGPASRIPAWPGGTRWPLLPSPRSSPPSPTRNGSAGRAGPG